jgi:hypothetical protein
MVLFKTVLNHKSILSKSIYNFRKVCMCVCLCTYFGLWSGGKKKKRLGWVGFGEGRREAFGCTQGPPQPGKREEERPSSGRSRVSRVWCGCGLGLLKQERVRGERGAEGYKDKAPKGREEKNGLLCCK